MKKLVKQSSPQKAAPTSITVKQYSPAYAVTYRYYKISGHPLEFSGCASCGESRIDALRTQLINNQVMCMNCTSKRYSKRTCGICGVYAPCERHHVRGRDYPNTCFICLNCHSRISQLQRQYPQYKSSMLWGVLTIIFTWFEVTVLQIGVSDG